jgi:hypothetical protein
VRRASVASIVVLPIAPARASAATFPTGPPGSPDAYVCTAAAQIVKIDGATGAKTLFANGTGSFDDCRVGPDGDLYIANELQPEYRIARVRG